MTTLLGIPPNMSVLAAMSAGLLPRNLQITGANGVTLPTNPNPTIGSQASAAGAFGTAQNGASAGNAGIGSGILAVPDGQNALSLAAPASSITTANPPQLG